MEETLTTNMSVLIYLSTLCSFGFRHREVNVLVLLKRYYFFLIAEFKSLSAVVLQKEVHWKAFKATAYIVNVGFPNIGIYPLNSIRAYLVVHKVYSL